MCRGLVEGGLAVESVVAEVVAVVGGEDDGGVVQQALGPERVDDLADLVVDLLDEPGVVCAGVFLPVV